MGNRPGVLPEKTMPSSGLEPHTCLTKGVRSLQAKKRIFPREPPTGGRKAAKSEESGPNQVRPPLSNLKRTLLKKKKKIYKTTVTGRILRKGQ